MKQKHLTPGMGPMSESFSVETFRFDVAEIRQNFERPDLSGLKVEHKDYHDRISNRFVDQLSTKIAAKKTSKTVGFHKTVTFSFFVPASWFDHLLIDHPWMQKLFFWYEVKQEEVADAQDVSYEETVEFAALIPQLQVPEQARDSFEVYYTVL